MVSARGAAAAVTLGLAAPAAGACDLALLFALDVSASVDVVEYRVQANGLADALRDPEVAEAVAALPGGVALAAYEWSGRYQQTVVSSWQPIATPRGLWAFAEVIETNKRSYDEFPTAIGYALGYGAVMMRSAPDCTRQVIDISGDGVGNEGFPPDAAYREFDFASITVNGLAIGGSDPAVIRYYQANIPHGPGAFVEVADGYGDYPDAIRRKLLRELRGAQFVMAE